MAQLSVSYERKFSDGNYGSEGLSVAWTWDSDAEVSDVVGRDVSLAAETLRELVLTELARSASERVRWAANHELRAHDPKPVDEEVWRQAEESAEYELAAGLHDNARQGELEDLPF